MQVSLLKNSYFILKKQDRYNNYKVSILKGLFPIYFTTFPKRKQTLGFDIYTYSYQNIEAHTQVLRISGCNRSSSINSLCHSRQALSHSFDTDNKTAGEPWETNHLLFTYGNRDKHQRKK